MTVRINKQKINLREKLTEFEDKVNFDEVVRGLGEYDGNVGIGTANPQSPLHVYNSKSSACRLYLQNLSSSDYFDTCIYSQNSDLVFDAGRNPRMRITSTGNVGIGTASPGVKLDVNDNTVTDNAWNTLARFRPDLGDQPAEAGINIQSHPSTTTPSDRKAGIQSADDAGNARSLILNKDGGNVGIGTTNPGARLQVKATNSGDVNIHANNITNRASFTMAGVGPTPTDENSYEIGPGYINLNRDDTVTIKQIQFGKNGAVAGYIETAANTTAYITSSDYRLKENVVAINGAIERINKLKPCRFNFIKTPEQVVDGFIAHEVQEVVPEAISGEKDEEDENGNIVPQGIDQSKLVPLLTSAIQEQQSIIEDLKSRIETLESK